MNISRRGFLKSVGGLVGFLALGIKGQKPGQIQAKDATIELDGQQITPEQHHKMAVPLDHNRALVFDNAELADVHPRCTRCCYFMDFVEATPWDGQFFGRATYACPHCGWQIIVPVLPTWPDTREFYWGEP